MKELNVFEQASMTSIEIAELVNKRHDNVKRTIETLVKRRVIQSPQIEEIENKQSLGPRKFSEAYIFQGEQGKRDSIIVVAQLSPKFTARLVDRWQELEAKIRNPVYAAELQPPRDYKEALQHILIHIEKNERLAAENTEIKKLAEKTRPKAMMFDMLGKGNDKLYSLTEVARIMNLSAVKVGRFLDQYEGVYAVRKSSKTSRQFLKPFVEKGFGRNILVDGGYINSKFTFKGVCFVAVKLAANGVIQTTSIQYPKCREIVEKELLSAR